MALSIGGGGTNGNDTLVATDGFDILSGLMGDDIYLYDNFNSVGSYDPSSNTHSGSDILVEGGGFDIIKFTDPLAKLSDFSFSYSGNDVIISAVSGPAMGGSITLHNQLLGGNSFFEQIQFWNGITETNVVDLAHLVVGTTGNDTLSGSTFNDTFSANEDDDTIKASSGNDFINGGPAVNTVDYSTVAGPISADLV
ncbi:MAG TPA: hypothetical protein VH107_19955, partial [Lacipirellulaceae bacterium]|nr:hypothetical protein [Lacipirellulaceae bacterium]